MSRPRATSPPSLAEFYRIPLQTPCCWAEFGWSTGPAGWGREALLAHGLPVKVLQRRLKNNSESPYLEEGEGCSGTHPVDLLANNSLIDQHLVIHHRGNFLSFSWELELVMTCTVIGSTGNERDRHSDSFRTQKFPSQFSKIACWENHRFCDIVAPAPRTPHYTATQVRRSKYRSFWLKFDGSGSWKVYFLPFSTQIALEPHLDSMFVYFGLQNTRKVSSFPNGRWNAWHRPIAIIPQMKNIPINSPCGKPLQLTRNLENAPKS